MAFSQYQAFVAAAQLKNMTKAADRLGYTQSGISRLVTALETDLGVILLKRTQRGVSPTPEGEILLP
jgi:DNA-binding transcriptional LysR family regulator